MRILHSKIFPGLLAVVFTLGSVGLSHADEALRRVQQSLRDQGFYYGSIDGSPGDETTQAIRRYQIRNGLTVTGQLNPETQNAIARTGAASAAATKKGSDSGSTRPPSSTPPPLAPTTSRSVPAPTPSARDRGNAATDEPDYRLAPRQGVQPAAPNRGAINGNGNNEEDEDMDSAGGPPPYRNQPGRPDLRANPSQSRDVDAPPPARYGSAPSSALTALFERTPYEFAPPAVQADMLRRVQVRLGRSGFYDGEPNGVPSRGTAEAIANFQEVNRLRPTARLDISTLGALRMLPERQFAEPRYANPYRSRGVYEGRIVE